MPSIPPGGTSQTVRAERVRATLSGAGAPSALLEVSGGPFELRAARPGTWVVEASESGSTTLHLTAANQTDGRMTGHVSLTLITVPVADSGRSQSSVTFDVTELIVEGRSRVETLRISRDDELFWTFENLLKPAPIAAAQTGSAPSGGSQGQQPRSDHAGESPDGPLLREMRHIWGDLPMLEQRVLVAVDRSASMSWTYAEGGLLSAVISAVAATSQVALQDRTAQWASFGSGESTADMVAMAPRGCSLADLRPALFSSGSDPSAALRVAGERGFDQVVIVTDLLESLARSAPDPTPAVVVLACGYSDLLDDWSGPALKARELLESRGCQVVPISVQDVEDQVARALASRWRAESNSTGMST